MGDGDPLIGRQLGNVRIDRVLGRGGMATVYYGWDIKLARPVAVKVIDTRHQGEEAYAQRFINEARAVATWHHPNILQVHSADDQEGLYYFVMEYVPGQDLAALLAHYRQQGKLLPPPEVMRIGRAVANGLDYAHARGVIHRDVKPANVMVADDGRVVVMDFGLALNVAQGTIGTAFGSPQYFAPEQASNSAEAVPQSDLYSLGVMLYEMLTGQLPFDDPSPLALAMQHIGRTPPSPRQFNPALSLAVEDVLLKALQKSPPERFQTGQALMDALGRALDVPPPTLPFLDNRPELAPPASAPDAPTLVPPAVAGGIGVAGALRPIRAGVAAVWAKVRSFPPTGPVTTYLHAHPAARWGAGIVAAVLIVETIWLGGASYRAGRDAAAGPASGTPRPTAVAVAGTAPQPTLAPAIPSPSSAPTEAAATTLPGQGNHFVLYYDDTAFYFRNASANDRQINPVAFERLDKHGKPTNRFDGSRWSQIYPTSRAGSCEVIQLIDYSSHLDPAECANHHIVVRTPFANDPSIFWTTEKMVTQFRVLWNNNEVGRCDIAAKTCDVYLP